MGRKNIPQYHAAYTEEDNKAIQEYLDQATPESLIESIQELCQLYPEKDREKVLNAIDNFAQRVANRNDLYQRYQKLLDCRDAWTKYRNDLETYPKIEEIRETYKNYKKSPGKLPEGQTLFDNFMRKYGDTVCAGYSDSTVKKFLVSNKKSSGIKRPYQPRTFYCTIEEVPITPMTKEDALKTLGKENLESLLLMLLKYVDSPEGENPAPLLVSFLNVRYSRENHKSHHSAFTSTLPEDTELYQDCRKILDELKILKEESSQLKGKSSEKK